MKPNSQRKFHDVNQNSEEWFNLRLGKITSSNFDKICANIEGAFGNPAKQYAQAKALEIVTGQRDENGFKSSYFDRGHELEPLARDLYELETFNHVTNGGFTSWKMYGDSTDGMVGDNGCIEIKSVIPNTHWKNIQRKGCDPAYKWQIQGHLLIGDKDWCDFVSYCPEFPENKQLFVYRIEKDEEMQKKLIKRLSEFDTEVDKYLKILQS